MESTQHPPESQRGLFKAASSEAPDICKTNNQEITGIKNTDLQVCPPAQTLICGTHRTGLWSRQDVVPAELWSRQNATLFKLL